MPRCEVEDGRGLGGINRKCQVFRGVAHTRHTDMPFLAALRVSHPRVAEKIERDSFQTRGASWGAYADGNQARRNRQPRWSVVEGEAFYPAHHQTYENCLAVAAELTVQAYEMRGAP